MITVLAKQPGKSHFLGWRLQLRVLAGKARCLPLHSIFFQFEAGPFSVGGEKISRLNIYTMLSFLPL